MQKRTREEIAIPIHTMASLARKARLRKRLSQEGLAAQANTNRTRIAHFEQALRAPPPDVLKRIEKILNVRFQHISVKQRSTQLPSRVPFLTVVGGLPGTGKTTLVRQLALLTDGLIVPEIVPAKDYLRDLATDPQRWAFETQLGFLVNKQVQLASATTRGRPIIQDRSFAEDVSVFAKHFIRTGAFDGRASKTYQELANFLLANSPAADLYIYCHCGERERLRRTKRRERSDMVLHNEKNYARSIKKLYKSFDPAKAGSKTIIRIDTGVLDVRSGDTARLILSLAQGEPDMRDSQIELFNSKKGRSMPRGLRIQRGAPSAARSVELQHRRDAIGYPAAYIGGPFSALATGTAKPGKQQVLPLAKSHGRIGKGRYRNLLTRVEHNLQKLGFYTFLPHRDVNLWGDRELSPEEVYRRCSERAMSCDLFVGILAESAGTHLEFGLAHASKRPCLIIKCLELAESYMARGIRERDGEIKILECKKVAEIPNLLQNQATVDFLRKSFSTI